MNVLVLESDPGTRRLYETALTTEGHSTDFVGTAEDGLSRQLNHSYELILLDLALPGAMSGLDFLRRLKSQRRPPPPIIAVATQLSIDAAIALGKMEVHSFFAKPVDPDELVRAVESAARQSSDPLVDYIRENHGAIQSKVHVAMRYGISPRTVLNRVRRATQRSFHEFLQDCRIEASQRLLRDTELCVKQVAARVGFTTPQAFARTFRTRTHLSPLEYRRKTRHEFSLLH